MNTLTSGCTIRVSMASTAIRMSAAFLFWMPTRATWIRSTPFMARSSWWLPNSGLAQSA